MISDTFQRYRSTPSIRHFMAETDLAPRHLIAPVFVGSVTEPIASLPDCYRYTPAAAVEEAALNDDYFKDRGLYPNIDFYSGVILTALRIPTAMFTPLFVIGRVPGWLAQWSELKQDPKHKIARPRQLYTGN